MLSSLTKFISKERRLVNLLIFYLRSNTRSCQKADLNSEILFNFKNNKINTNPNAVSLKDALNFTKGLIEKM